MNNKWQKIGSRRAALQKAVQFAYGVGNDIDKAYNLPPIQQQLYLFDGRTTAIYFDKKGVETLSLALKKKLNDQAFILGLHKKIKEISDETIQQGIEATNINLNQLNNDELFDLVIHLERIWRNFYPHAWLFWFMHVLEESVTEALRKMEFKGDINSTIAVISQPYLLTPLQAAELEIKKLAQALQEGAKEKQIKQKAALLAKEYGWMSVYNFDDKPHTANYFLSSAKKILKDSPDIKQDITKAENKRQQNEILYKEIIDQVDDKLLKIQIEFLHLAGYLRDFREKARDKLTYIVRPVYENIGKRVNFSLQEVTSLTTPEIKTLLTDPSKHQQLRIKANRRQNKFALMVNNDTFEVIDKEDEVKKIANSLKVSGTSIIKGQIAHQFKKNVRGVVKVVLSNKEMAKIKTGDIFVTSMTKPDYINAMRKASAIVTDEGGLLSHAAIVSRELDIPCLVNTKIATQVLKDGDEVEVDAVKGVVTKLS